MTYSVKEIYYTVQGEGANAGRAAVFLRFAGCNLWSGREKDRHKGPGGCSRWCDTSFVGTDGPGGGIFKDAGALAQAVADKWPTGVDLRHPGFVVCTGGEPLLQMDGMLLKAFEARHFAVAVETNGTQPAPLGHVWLTVSPKANAPLKIRKGNELKLVYPQESIDPEQFVNLEFDHFYLQPMDGPAQAQNTQLAIDYCLKHPLWRLSLQTHKFIGMR
jgi:7-carboxy-7-deazaguanine synthase